MKQPCECSNTNECGLDKGFTLGEKWCCKKELEATESTTPGVELNDLLYGVWHGGKTIDVLLDSDTGGVEFNLHSGCFTTVEPRPFRIQYVNGVAMKIYDEGRP